MHNYLVLEKRTILILIFYIYSVKLIPKDKKWLKSPNIIWTNITEQQTLYKIEQAVLGTWMYFSVNILILVIDCKNMHLRAF